MIAFTTVTTATENFDVSKKNKISKKTSLMQIDHLILGETNTSGSLRIKALELGPFPLNFIVLIVLGFNLL